MFSLDLPPHQAPPLSMLRLPGPANRAVDPVAAAAAQPVSVAFDFQQFLAGTASAATGVGAFRELCRSPEVAARVGPGARVPNALGNGAPTTELTLARMLLRRALREDAGKQAVAQESAVGALPLVYHPDLAELAAPPPPPTAPKKKRRVSIQDLEAEEGDESSCSTEHSSQEGESLGSDDTDSDGDDDDDSDDLDDDDNALISNVNSMSGDELAAEDAPSSDSEFVAADSDDSEDGSALFSCDSDDSDDDDQSSDTPATMPSPPSSRLRKNAALRQTISELSRVLETVPIDEGLSSEDEPEGDADSDESSGSSADSAEADDSDDEPLLGLVDVVQSDDALAPPAAADSDSESDAPVVVRKPAVVAVAPLPSAAAFDDDGPLTPPVRKRAPVSDGREEKKRVVPEGPSPVEVLRSAMAFAVALRGGPTDRSALYQMSNGAPGDPALRDAYLAMMDRVPERYAFLRYLHDQYRLVPEGPGHAAAVAALCAELAATIP